jgi:hypothetical protein
VYRAQRALFAEELGLEPGPALRRLESAILRQDPRLATLRDAWIPEKDLPLVLAVAVGQTPSPGLVQIAVDDAHETILLQLVADEESLSDAAAAVDERRARSGGNVRAAAFVAADWCEDVVRFAGAHDAALVLVDAPSDVVQALSSVLRHSTADVGLVVRGDAGIGDGPVFVPFGGSEHDWAALEIAAAVARASDRAVRLVGTGAGPGRPRDASRLLADASLAVQRAFGITSAPILAPATPDALVAIVEEAAIVVAGVGSRWPSNGLDAVRAALAAEARPPLVLVHRGPRPGLLAPHESRTRFTWSLQN